jgi:hypothetical protein
MTNTFKRMISGLALPAAVSGTCLGDIIYQANDPTLTSAYSAGSSATGEIGDEVVLADAGLQFTGISIKYYANYNLPGGLTLTIYPQTGPIIQGFPSPDISNPLFQVRTDVLAGNHLLNVNYSLGDFYLPKDFTFSLRFRGLGGGPDDAGVFLGGPATVPDEVGGSGLNGRGNPQLPGLSGDPNRHPFTFDDVWTRTGPAVTDWALNHITGGYANLNAVITGNVPEPGSLSLGILGCVAFASSYAHLISKHRRKTILKYEEHI